MMKRPHDLYENKSPKEPLLKRSWVFQEQILTSRLIHLAPGELYFRCQSHFSCECRGWEKRSDTPQWEARWGKAHSVLLGRVKLDSKPEIKARQEFEAYRALVESFTQLEITQELDRLPALSGITFGRSDEYLAGMWKSSLLESLHWYPSPPSESGLKAHRPHEWRGPTWRWISIECPLRHIEHEFGGYEAGIKLTGEIMEAWCTPEGLDPRGRVSGGYIKIQAPVANARVTEIGICPRKSEKGAIDVTSEDLFPKHLEPSFIQWEKIKQFCTYATPCYDYQKWLGIRAPCRSIPQQRPGPGTFDRLLKAGKC